MHIFGIITNYNPRWCSNKQEIFISSASYLEVPKSPISSFNFGRAPFKRGYPNKKAMSVVSAQPTSSHPYESKLLLKDIDDYILMENNMVALFTLPQPDDRSEDVYPRLLILLLSQSNEDTKASSIARTKGTHIYEIPSPLHMIDLKKTQFVTTGNTLV